jgi:hypothetical protein
MGPSTAKRTRIAEGSEWSVDSDMIELERVLC